MAEITTPDLEIAYSDSGPKDGLAVLLLHGWPDDASTWDQVAPPLNAAGLRTIVPTLRGFGQTRFRVPGTPRTGDSGILAMDAVALMDALGIERFFVAGHDWGSTMAESLAIGWPDRVGRIAMLSSMPRMGGVPLQSFAQAQRQWYHWLMATRRGERMVRQDPRGFARIMWVNWSPKGWFDPAAFDRVAASFDNPDWIDVTLHSYRARWDEAEPDPRSRWLEDAVRTTQQLAVPALYVQGEVDGVNPPEVSESVAAKFSGPFERIVLPGVGHFPTREAPEAVAARLVGLFGAHGQG
jgi:pimeloyl-ACP methyl ester carboxylesterase